MDEPESTRRAIPDLYIEPHQYREDIGSLIPPHTPYTTGEFVLSASAQGNKSLAKTAIAFMFMLLMLGGYFSLQILPGWTAVEAVEMPAVVVNYNNATQQKVLSLGPEPLLSQPNFFADTITALKDAEEAFIEADLSAMKLRYHASGAVQFETDILAKGKEGSWWETPAGLYQIELKKDNHFSSFGQVYQPWSMVFQGNFFIHGWPEYEDGTPVPEGYSGGCIRLATDEAEKLFALVAVDTPVLVYEEDFVGDSFQYEPNVPELTARHYLVTDIHNNIVLAGENIEAVVPIASITKLMTALIAAEYINLERTVRISPEKYVDTLIPRLSWRYQASMYSLLQLLLVESSNEAAEVIASVIGRDQFISHMNDKAQALGMHNTVFADPSGLDDGNVSSPADMVRLLQYLHNNRSFILKLTKDADLPTAYISGEFDPLTNFNTIEELDNVIGGKVGETLAAGQTAAALHVITANGGEERVIAIVVLGSEDRSGDIIRLNEYVIERYGE